MSDSDVAFDGLGGDGIGVPLDVDRMRMWQKRISAESSGYKHGAFDLEALRPGFVGHGEFFHNLREFYTCFIAGGLGKGKTLLAFAIVHFMAYNGWIDRVISNIRSCLNEPIAYPLVDAGIIFDESWLKLNSRDWNSNDATTYAAFLRKLNTYLILPSRIMIDKMLREFWCQRTFCGDAFGLPLWVYKWRLESGMTFSEGKFAIFRPGRYFGLYDTYSRPMGDGGISEALRLTSPALTEFERRVVNPSGDMHSLSDVAVSERMSKSMAAFVAASKKRR